MRLAATFLHRGLLATVVLATLPASAEEISFQRNGGLLPGTSGSAVIMPTPIGDIPVLPDVSEPQRVEGESETSPAATAGAAAQRSGGLLPDAGGVGGRSTAAAELMRRWDLNADGRIDLTEAEIARSRMRSQRAEPELDGAGLQGGAATVEVDPLTGLPVRPADAAPVGRGPGTGGLSAARPAATDPLRGSDPRQDDPQRAGQKPGDAAKKTAPAFRGLQDPRRSANRPQPMIGGARAGAPAARPGYGAIEPKPDLNAGRLPAGLPAARGLPTQAGRSGLRSAASPLSGPQGRMAAPPPPASSRITAEEIGGP